MGEGEGEGRLGEGEGRGRGGAGWGGGVQRHGWGFFSLETGDQPFRSVPGLLSASLVFPHSAPGASDERLALVAPGGRAEAGAAERGGSPPARLWRPDLSEPEGRLLWAPVRGTPSGFLLGATPTEASPPPRPSHRLRGGQSKPATEWEGLGLQAPAWNPVP